MSDVTIVNSSKFGQVTMSRSDNFRNESFERFFIWILIRENFPTLRKVKDGSKRSEIHSSYGNLLELVFFSIVDRESNRKQSCHKQLKCQGNHVYITFSSKAAMLNLRRIRNARKQWYVMSTFYFDLRRLF